MFGGEICVLFACGCCHGRTHHTYGRGHTDGHGHGYLVAGEGEVGVGVQSAVVLAHPRHYKHTVRRELLVTVGHVGHSPVIKGREGHIRVLVVLVALRDVRRREWRADAMPAHNRRKQERIRHVYKVLEGI